MELADDATSIAGLPGTGSTALLGSPYSTPVEVSVEMTRSGIFNDVIIQGTGDANAATYNGNGVETTGPPALAEAADNNPQSPTYIGGAMGDVPDFVSSSIITDNNAQLMAQGTLHRAVHRLERDDYGASQSDLRCRRHRDDHASTGWDDQHVGSVGHDHERHQLRRHHRSHRPNHRERPDVRAATTREAHQARLVSTKTAQKQATPTATTPTRSTSGASSTPSIQGPPPPSISCSTGLWATRNVTANVKMLAGYSPTVGDVVLVYRGSRAQSHASRVILHKLNGSASPTPLALGSINNAGSVRLWLRGAVGWPRGSPPGLGSIGDGYWQTDVNPTIWQKTEHVNLVSASAGQRDSSGDSPAQWDCQNHSPEGPDSRLKVIASSGGGGYASLTGPGETETPGALTQAGGFIVEDTLGTGLYIYRAIGLEALGYRPTRRPTLSLTESFWGTTAVVGATGSGSCKTATTEYSLRTAPSRRRATPLSPLDSPSMITAAAAATASL